jgi:hypothetical protein
MAKKEILKKYFPIILLMIIFCISLIGCAPLELLIPIKGEITLDDQQFVNELKEKNVDFIGLQVFFKADGYNNTRLYKYKGKNQYLINADI